jgi:hypothetical protein
MRTLQRATAKKFCIAAFHLLPNVPISCFHTQDYFSGVAHVPPLPFGALHSRLERAGAGKGARSLACDAIIFDLEDAVAPEEKPRGARSAGAGAARGGLWLAAQIVRINGFDTPWGREDAGAMARAIAAGAQIDALLVPKVSRPLIWMRWPLLPGDRRSGR